jgi:hypothetical protein
MIINPFFLIAVSAAFLSGCLLTSLIWSLIVINGRKRRDRVADEQKGLVRKIAELCVSIDSATLSYKSGKLPPAAFRAEFSTKLEHLIKLFKLNLQRFDIYYAKYVEKAISDYQGYMDIAVSSPAPLPAEKVSPVEMPGEFPPAFVKIEPAVDALSPESFEMTGKTGFQKTTIELPSRAPTTAKLSREPAAQAKEETKPPAKTIPPGPSAAPPPPKKPYSATKAPSAKEPIYPRYATPEPSANRIEMSLEEIGRALNESQGAAPKKALPRAAADDDSEISLEDLTAMKPRVPVSEPVGRPRNDSIMITEPGMAFKPNLETVKIRKLPEIAESKGRTEKRDAGAVPAKEPKPGPADKADVVISEEPPTGIAWDDVATEKTQIIDANELSQIRKRAALRSSNLGPLPPTPNAGMSPELNEPEETRLITGDDVIDKLDKLFGKF